ncbi:MAG: flagellar hook protein FlgE [Acidimicrobiales bacterium]
MYSAVTGLRNHQTMMDVVGNNIANVNTTGFKKSNAIFQDVLSQTLEGAGAPVGELGGTNPAQIGLGVRIGAIAQNLSQGALQRTGRDLDLSIEGDGFFVVQDQGAELYTRAGAFFVDAAGQLVTADGGMVQGWQADPSGLLQTDRPVGDIKIPIGEASQPVATTVVNLGGNLSADAALGTQDFTSVTVYDSQGIPIVLDITYTKSNTDEWTVTASYGDPPTAVPVTDNIMQFGADGELVLPVDFTANIAAGAIPGAEAIALTLGGEEARRISQYGGNSTMTVINQNGSSSGSLQSLSIGQDGVITGSYSNGRVRAMAQLALATFANPEGLSRVTGTSWTTSANSGLAQIGAAGGGGRGLLAAGALEMSNVDLAEEFTTLIRSQRGFQANSRVVTASDELLQEIVNMKR